jgi:hypothetical protein
MVAVSTTSQFLSCIIRPALSRTMVLYVSQFVCQVCSRGAGCLVMTAVLMATIIEHRFISLQCRFTLQAGRSGDRIPAGERYSAPVQTGPGAHPASYTMGTCRFPGVKLPGCGVNNPPHLTSRLKKEQSYTSTPSLGLRGLF